MFQELHFVGSNHCCSLCDFVWLNYILLLEAKEKVSFFPLTSLENQN